MTVAGNHGKERAEQTFLSCHLNPSHLVILFLARLSPYNADAQLTVAHSASIEAISVEVTVGLVDSRKKISTLTHT